ncbi:MOSC domain-containing protein [Phenylobacterium sp.]|jgi:uncharacterized protein YcbX|uniref:MOSC domain-containing protein n=1 Tax=Phenylobacterium sp. TaxID=1871053 RepID=UPI0037836B8F
MRQQAGMVGRIASLFRYPVKGFTPEAVDEIVLTPGVGIAFDRLWAVEDGPPRPGKTPDFVPKQKFAVLASTPRVAAVRTRLDDATGELSATAEDCAPFSGRLSDPADREAFAAWLRAFLGEDVRNALRVVEAEGPKRYTDHPNGQLSIINLASVRDLSARMGVELDPLRFRGNIYVEGWPAWIENDWTGRELSVGSARVEVFDQIVRCAATHVNPVTACRDQEIVRGLFDNYGHMNCGLYCTVVSAGEVRAGESADASLETA